MMSGAALDMSLDDLIKKNKKSAPRGRGRAAGPGPARRLPNRFADRVAPYAVINAPGTTWGHDMFASGSRALNVETETKLYISNLDYGVSNEDIKELFLEVGDLKWYVIHYDRSGRSKGTAEVVFSSQQAAFAAIKKYNNVQLDGKPMKIEIVGTNIPTPGVGLPHAGLLSFGGLGNSYVAPRSVQGRGGFGRPQGGRGGGFTRGRGRGRGRVGEKVSAEDLDADLEKYHADAMQTN